MVHIRTVPERMFQDQEKRKEERLKRKMDEDPSLFLLEKLKEASFVLVWLDMMGTGVGFIIWL